MISPLDDLLSVETLTGLVKIFSEQGSNRSCTSLFTDRARPLLPEGDSASWDEVEYSRHMAPVTGPDSPHTRAKRTGVRKRSSAMAYVKAYKDLPASHLFLNRAPGSSLANAEAVLAIELEDLANLIANTKEFLATGALLGRIDVSNQTVPGSEINFTVEFGNNTADARDPWSDPATKIRGDELIRLKQIYKDASGLNAVIGVTEPSVEGFLVKNVEVREFAKEVLGIQIVRNLNLQGSNPQWESVGGLSLSFTDGTYKPEGGPVTRYFPKGKLVVLPAEERLGAVLGWAEGRVCVPDRPFHTNPARALECVQEQRGTYAYAELRTDPLGIRIYAGWYGLPVVLNPNAVLVYDTTPGAAAPAPTPAP